MKAQARKLQLDPLTVEASTEPDMLFALARGGSGKGKGGNG